VRCRERGEPARGRANAPRVLIDRQLNDAGWVVQDRESLNLVAGPGVAVREVVMAKGHGRADYLLYVDQHAVGVIEAKPVGSTADQVHAGCARAAIFELRRQMGQCENDLTLDTQSLSERGPEALTRLVEPPRNP